MGSCCGAGSRRSRAVNAKAVAVCRAAAGGKATRAVRGRRATPTATARGTWRHLRHGSVTRGRHSKTEARAPSHGRRRTYTRKTWWRTGSWRAWGRAGRQRSSSMAGAAAGRAWSQPCARPAGGSRGSSSSGWMTQHPQAAGGGKRGQRRVWRGGPCVVSCLRMCGRVQSTQRAAATGA
jgi:hypothetical protein